MIKSYYTDFQNHPFRYKKKKFIFYYLYRHQDEMKIRRIGEIL